MSVQKNKANENKATQLIDIEELANIGSFQWDAETGYPDMVKAAIQDLWIRTVFSGAIF